MAVGTGLEPRLVCGCASLYVSEVANGPGKIHRGDGAVPRDDAKRMRGFPGRVLAMKVGLETPVRKFSFCSCLSRGKMTLHAHFSVKQEAA